MLNLVTVHIGEGKGHIPRDLFPEGPYVFLSVKIYRSLNWIGSSKRVIFQERMQENQSGQSPVQTPQEMDARSRLPKSSLGLATLCDQRCQEGRCLSLPSSWLHYLFVVCSWNAQFHQHSQLGSLFSKMRDMTVLDS